MQDAHAKEQNVLLDYVANHVHELHPVYQKHPGSQSWAARRHDTVHATQNDPSLAAAVAAAAEPAPEVLA